MPDYPDFQLVLYHDLKACGFEIGTDGTTVPTDVDYATGSLPELIPVGASLKIKTKIYDDQARTKYHDFTNITKAYLYGWPVGSPAVPTLLDEGTVSGVTPTNGECLFAVPKDTIPEAWATYEAVRFYFDFYDTDSRLRLWQDLAIKSMQYDNATEYPDSSQVAIFYVSPSTDLTLSVYPGWQIVRINASAANVTVTLPRSTATDANGRTCGRITILHDLGAFDAKVAMNVNDAAGINGYTTSPFILGGIGKGIDINPNSAGTGWLHAAGGISIS